MAAIYKVKKSGEVHVYRNRVPRKDGGEPVLGWLFVAVPLFCLRGLPFLFVILGALLVEGAFGAIAAFVRENLYAVLFDIWILAWLGWYIFSRFQKIVFSPRTGNVYSGFLFFRRKIAKFSDFAAIELSEQEMMAKPRHSFVATWLGDRTKAPLRLSPQVKNKQRLSRYYHSVIPCLNELLGLDPEGAEAMEVGVEEVEVPVEEATRIIRRSSTSVRARSQTRTQTRSKSIFTRSKGVYTVNHAGLTVLAVVAGAGFCLGLALMFSVIYPDNPWWLNYGIQAVCFGVYMQQMSYRSIRVSFDTRHRMIEYTTGFGLMKQACSFDMLRRFTIKRKNGFRTLCMVIDGQTVDPSIANSLSDARMRRALEEVCEITGMDPDSSLAA